MNNYFSFIGGKVILEKRRVGKEEIEYGYGKSN
jgi:hypothetical protein